VGIITATYPGKCTACGKPFPAGAQINHYAKGKATHASCATAMPVRMFAFFGMKDSNQYGLEYGEDEGKAMLVGLELAIELKMPIIVTRVTDAKAEPLAIIAAPPGAKLPEPEPETPAEPKFDAPVLEWDGPAPF